MSAITKTGYAILGMLSIHPMSGYDMRQLMQKSTQNFWSESDGQLYPNLAKLTQQKLITCKIAKQNNVRDKKTYSITAIGKKALKHWLEQEAETSLVRNEFMLKLFFGANVAAEIIREHIQAHRYQTKAKLTQLAETKKNLTDKHAKSPHFPYWQMTLQYGIRIAEAKLVWCDDVMQLLK